MADSEARRKDRQPDTSVAKNVERYGVLGLRQLEFRKLSGGRAVPASASIPKIGPINHC